MKKAVILHGTLGSPEGNWFRWLEKELQAKGMEVWLPTLPHAEKPSLKQWAAFVVEQCPFSIDEETLLVGHSSGAIAALVVAQLIKNKLGALVGVSVFHDNSLQWEPNNNLFDVNLDWDAIRAHTSRFFFVHSDNDPYVPLAEARFVADHCHAEQLVLGGQGHFNLEQSSDYSAFPVLLKELEVRHLL